jgi:outer membrane immunogenic protein
MGRVSTAKGIEIMERWLLGTAVALAMAAPAIAADLPSRGPITKAPPPVAPIGYNWTGCYVDGGGGYGMFNQDSFTNDGGDTTSKVTNGGRGWFGTVGAGCDVQFGSWVLGAFGNYDFAGLKGDVVIPGAGDVVGREKQDSAWAVGGRLGYTLTPTILTYVNAGYTQARFSGVDFFSQTGSGAPTGLSIGAHTYSGWFVGSGFEYNLGFMPGLFWRTEYRFAQYNRDSLPILDGGALTGATLESDKTIQTIRSELVWRFNWSGGRY